MEEVLSKPELARYLEGWGRQGDTAVLAVDLDGGRRLGAAWYRLMTSEEPGYGYVDDSTPEIALAVVPDHRWTRRGWSAAEGASGGGQVARL